MALESPSDDKAAVDRCGRAVAAALRDVGARVRVEPRAEAGDHIVATIGEGRRRVLLLGHFDTVWPVGQLAVMPIRRDNGRLYGPGVYDMKAGLVIGLLALRALFERGPAPPATVTMLATSDEETGSSTSRALIEDEARAHDAVLVLEPGLADGAVKTGRKGVGEYVVEVDGIPAHAGADPGRGASAIVELARQVLALERLQDPTRGLTVNVGVVSGGTRPNVVAARATAHVDVRIARLADAAFVDAVIRGLVAVDPRTRIRVTGGINRPPMERTPGVAWLYSLAREAGAALGLAVGEGSTGGASDGNFTAALGVPTLDGLGAIGDHAHGLDEHIVIAALPDRAALLAALVARIAATP